MQLDVARRPFHVCLGRSSLLQEAALRGGSAPDAPGGLHLVTGGGLTDRGTLSRAEVEAKRWTQT